MFVEVLEALGIEYHVAAGDSEKEIAALANHHRCPVLGTDSDYFMFNLEYGFIHFEQ